MVRSFFLDGPAGRLEALLNSGAENASHAALVCHPHPVYGGTMHNKVVFHAMKALNTCGFPVLRTPSTTPPFTPSATACSRSSRRGSARRCATS